MSDVENFILEKLSSEEQDTLDFSCPADLQEFIKSVGASMLPYEVKFGMWEQMQRAMQQQQRRMAMLKEREQEDIADSEDEAGAEDVEARAREREARLESLRVKARQVQRERADEILRQQQERQQKLE